MIIEGSLVLLFILLLFVIVILAIRYYKCISYERKLKTLIDSVSDINNIITSVRYGNLSARVEQSTLDEMKHLSESVNRMIETLNDREQMIVEYQSELTQQYKFLASLLNSLSDGILVLDEKYNILRINEKVKKWFNTTDIIGRSVFDFIKIADEKEITDLKGDEIFIKDNKDICSKASIR